MYKGKKKNQVKKERKKEKKRKEEFNRNRKIYNKKKDDTNINNIRVDIIVIFILMNIWFRNI